MFLREISTRVQFLKGVGPKMAHTLHKLGITTLAHLLTHFPRDYIDRSRLDQLVEAPSRERAFLHVQVIAHDYLGWGGRQTLKVHIQDTSARGVLLCFGRNFLKNTLSVGRELYISGSFKYKYGEIQSGNFEYEFADEDQQPPPILPLYPLCEGITQNFLRRILPLALEHVAPELDNELPAYMLKQYCLPEKHECLKAVHSPANNTELQRARRGLKFEELFYLQLIMGRKRLKRHNRRHPRQRQEKTLKKRLLERLPFSLTSGQSRAIEEIEEDLFSPAPMARLLQGDVGCGKTLVAVIASLAVCEAGEQVAFLAPTELLAKQHAESIAGLLEPLGIKVAFLAGSVKATPRALLLAALARGEVDILVGTHALFSKDVQYHSLGLVIIDEQHKFGVMQRLAIQAKGNDPDTLLMTATPIPRSLALTAFADLELSEIKTMPCGRKPVRTHLTRQGNEHKVYERVKQELNCGRQAYFVYPLIEGSEKLSLKDAESMYHKLNSEIFAEFRLGLIHSRIDEEKKRQLMADFQCGKLDILVATSVVEVGVDVPNATVIVIEHAERFGLSALHQLRGRVGRSELQSYAFLIYSHRLTPEGIKRLKVIKETGDGFKLAEEDLAIRGPGELLGVRQAGFLKLSCADLIKDKDLLLESRKEVRRLLREDPGLLQPEHAVIREVLLKAPPFDESILDSG